MIYWSKAQKKAYAKKKEKMRKAKKAFEQQLPRPYERPYRPKPRPYQGSKPQYAAPKAAVSRRYW